MKPDKRKSLPGAKADTLLANMREVLQGYLGFDGDKLDRGVTVRDLANAGLIDVSKTYLANGSRNPIGRVNTIITSPGTGGSVIIPGGTYEPDLTPPPTPSGFTVSAGISHLFIECANQTYTEGHGHGFTRVFGAKRTVGPPPTFADAVEITTFAGTVDAHPTDPNTTWHLWIKWVSKDGVPSSAPAGGTNGLVAETGQDVRSLLDALTDAASAPSAPYTRLAVRAGMFYVASDVGPTDASLFSVVTAPITVNGVVVPAGVYMAGAFIQNGTIVNAKIGNLAVDNAKIASVSADKITAGTIAVGQYIQSTNYVAGSTGWRINGLGNVEFNNAIFRGSAFIGTGLVGGIQITATSIRSSNYNGLGAGFLLGSDGTLDLPGGSVTALQLNVGNGANLLQNSTWVDRAGANAAIPIGWAFASTEPSGATFYRSPASFPDWCPPSLQGLVMESTLGPHTGTSMLVQGAFPAIPGRRYEGSVLAGSHRCRVYTEFQWIDATGAVLSTVADSQVDNVNGVDIALGGGKRLDLFKKIGHFGVAPSLAAYGVLRIIKGPTLSGASSYGHFLMPFVGLAKAQQTVFSDYSPSGIGTVVTPNGVLTPTLQALTAILGDVHTGSIRGGSYVGYAWPTNGDGGFYLGPSGLLLGNGNVGRYFQATRDGDIYTPGFSVVGGVMTVHQANVITSLNIAGGAVATSAWARGHQAAGVGVNVPAGEVHLVHLIASWEGRWTQFSSQNPSNGGTYGLIGLPNMFMPPSTVITGSTGGDADQPIYGSLRPPVTMTSLLALGAGGHWLTCGSDSATDCTLVANIMRRP